MSTARNRKTELFISALLSSRSVEEAAVKTKIALITARRWMRDPGFIEQFREARKEVMQQAISQIQQATIESIAALREVVVHGESEGSRVAAARTILENGLRSYQFEQLESRVEDLERLAH